MGMHGFFYMKNTRKDTKILIEIQASLVKHIEQF